MLQTPNKFHGAQLTGGRTDVFDNLSVGGPNLVKIGKVQCEGSFMDITQNVY